MFRPAGTILEINTRVWLRQLGGGTPISLSQVADEHLDLWQSRSVDAVWLMGVWTPSARSREIARAHEGLQKDYAEALSDWKAEDITASPYAIVGYTVNPELGGEEGLRAFREKLRARGMRLFWILCRVTRLPIIRGRASIPSGMCREVTKTSRAIR